MELRGIISTPEMIHGKSAYEIALINGFVGSESEWLKSLHGKNATDEQVASALNDYMLKNNVRQGEGMVTLTPTFTMYYLKAQAITFITSANVSLFPAGYHATIVYSNLMLRESEKELWEHPIETVILKDTSDNGMPLSELTIGIGNDGVLIHVYKTEGADKFNWYLSNVQSDGSNKNGAWADINYTRVDGLVETDWGEIVSHAPAYYAEVKNIDRYKKVKVKGYQYAIGAYSVCYFLDAYGAIIEAHKGNAESAEYETELIVPETAKTLIVNGEIYTEEPVTIKGYCEITEEETEGVWEEVPYNRTEGYYVALDGSIGPNSISYYAEIDNIDKYQKVTVEGYQFDMRYYSMCLFLDANGKVVETYQGTGDNTVYRTTVDVPQSAKTLLVNGKIYAPNPIFIEGYKEITLQTVYDKLPPTGVKLMTLGDSITEPVDGWVKYFIEKTECQLVANVAVIGAWLNDKEGTIYDGNPVFNGPDNNINNVLGNQVQKILNENYEAPDIIMIAIGTNSGIWITKEQIKAVYYDENNDLIPLENVDRKTSAGAYRWCLEKLHAKYPNATIFWCTPIMGYQKIRSADFAMDYAESLRIATEYTGQIMIDTIRCGINGVNERDGANGEYLVDGLHPNINGAKKIGYYNASKVMPFLGNSLI